MRYNFSILPACGIVNANPLRGCCWLHRNWSWVKDSCLDVTYYERKILDFTQNHGPQKLNLSLPRHHFSQAVELLPGQSSWSLRRHFPPLCSRLFSEMIVCPPRLPREEGWLCQLPAASQQVLWMFSQSGCRRQKVMPHKLFTGFTLESISPWSLVATDIPTNTLCSLPHPQILCHCVYLNEFKCVPVSAGCHLLPLDCIFILGLWNIVQTQTSL